jgi:hypothetical protein
MHLTFAGKEIGPGGAHIAIAAAQRGVREPLSDMRAMALAPERLSSDLRDNAGILFGTGRRPVADGPVSCRPASAGAGVCQSQSSTPRT